MQRHRLQMARSVWLQNVYTGGYGDNTIACIHASLGLRMAAITLNACARHLHSVYKPTVRECVVKQPVYSESTAITSRTPRTRTKLTWLPHQCKYASSQPHVSSPLRTHVFTVNDYLCRDAHTHDLLAATLHCTDTASSTEHSSDDDSVSKICRVNSFDVFIHDVFDANQHHGYSPLDPQSHVFVNGFSLETRTFEQQTQEREQQMFEKMNYDDAWWMSTSDDDDDDDADTADYFVT